MHFDAAKIGKSTNLAGRIEKKFGDIDNAILVFGDMGDEQDGDLESLEQCIRVNFLGAALLAESIAERMVTRGVVVLSAFRQSQAIGVERKTIITEVQGGFTLFLQGLRNKLFEANVHVMTVRLGFMDSRMTYGQKSPIPTADPQLVASRIYQAHQRRHDDVICRDSGAELWVLFAVSPSSYSSGSTSKVGDVYSLKSGAEREKQESSTRNLRCIQSHQTAANPHSTLNSIL